MLIGNPNQFAFLLEVVPEWCSSSIINGVFHVYVNGVQYPSELRTTTLSTDLYHLLDDKSPFMRPQINRQLYYMDTHDLFKRLCEITFPEEVEIDNDYSFLIPLNELSNAGCYLFHVSTVEAIKIIVGIQNMLGDMKFVDEVVIDTLTMDNIKWQLQDFYLSNIKK